MTNEKTLPTGFKVVGVIRRSNNFTLPPINWTLWGSMYDVELWQAAALSLNINPDTIKDPTKFNHGNFKDRLRLLENWLPKKNRLMLCELAGKWSKIFKWQIPPELAAKARLYDELTTTEAAAPAAPAAKGETVPIASLGSDNDKKQDATGRCYWRAILNSNIKKIDKPKKAAVREIIKYLRELKDTRLPNRGKIDELVWIDDMGNEQCVQKKTVSTAASKARKLS